MGPCCRWQQLLALAIGLLLRDASPTTAAETHRPWMDPGKTVDERVTLLLQQMSVEEKVNQLLHVWGTMKDDDVLAKYGNTSVGAMYIAKHSANLTCDVVPSCRLAARNSLQRAVITRSRLGIPISFVSETLHSPMRQLRGAKGDEGMHRQSTPCARAIAAACPSLKGVRCKACVASHSATIMPKCPSPGQVDAACGRGHDRGHDMGCIFPMPAGQGASWNRSLVREVAAAVAVETRASGADRGFSPELQVATDPRFGRTQENFGEQGHRCAAAGGCGCQRVQQDDVCTVCRGGRAGAGTAGGDPFLVSELGVAATLGLHGGATGGPSTYLPNYTTTIISEAKHYAVRPPPTCAGPCITRCVSVLWCAELAKHTLRCCCCCCCCWRVCMHRCTASATLTAHQQTSPSPRCTTFICARKPHATATTVPVSTSSAQGMHHPHSVVGGVGAARDCRWKAYVAAGGRACMASHNSVNGRPCHSSAWLLTEVFRKELGCEKCMVGTDFRDIELLSDMNTANTSRYPGLPADTDASMQALAAGVDQDLGGYSYGSLLQASQQGLLPKERQGVHGIDTAAAAVLRTKFAAGLFDQPYTDPALLAQIDSGAHRALARTAVIEGATLLLNRGGVLPVREEHLRTVAVVGPNAGCTEGAAQPCPAQKAMAGGYNPTPSSGQIVTVAEALTQRLSKAQVTVVVDTGSATGVAAAANASQRADLAVVVVGDTADSCGESDDRMELDLLVSETAASLN
jgi:beta-glucosidase-like glycosyl hydrolase